MTSCTLVSTDLMPGYSYRENPIVNIIEYTDHAELQKDCYALHRRRGRNYYACVWVPYDPYKTCIIRIMVGDDKRLNHEMAHCHGYADTYFPWKANPDYF